MRNIKVYPSILSCDFANLEKELKRIEKTDAEGIHVDIMDGHFVDNITIGPNIVSAINRSTSMYLDVHLMIYNPISYIERFIAAGADAISFHCEATEDVEDTIQLIQSCNKKVGIALNPETSVSMIDRYLIYCDHVLIMTVHPGFGGQKFIEENVEKIKVIRDLREDLKLKFEIQVDGGINPDTARLCLDAGVDVIISGDYVFKHTDLSAGVNRLLNIYPNK